MTVGGILVAVAALMHIARDHVAPVRRAIRGQQ
jgi:hypothetical protein